MLSQTTRRQGHLKTGFLWSKRDTFCFHKYRSGAIMGRSFAQFWWLIQHDVPVLNLSKLTPVRNTRFHDVLMSFFIIIFSLELKNIGNTRTRNWDVLTSVTRRKSNTSLDSWKQQKNGGCSSTISPVSNEFWLPFLDQSRELLRWNEAYRSLWFSRGCHNREELLSVETHPECGARLCYFSAAGSCSQAILGRYFFTVHCSLDSTKNAVLFQAIKMITFSFTIIFIFISSFKVKTIMRFWKPQGQMQREFKEAKKKIINDRPWR